MPRAARAANRDISCSSRTPRAAKFMQDSLMKGFGSTSAIAQPGCSLPRRRQKLVWIIATEANFVFAKLLIIRKKFRRRQVLHGLANKKKPVLVDRLLLIKLIRSISLVEVFADFHSGRGLACRLDDAAKHRVAGYAVVGYSGAFLRGEAPDCAFSSLAISPAGQGSGLAEF